MEPHDSTGKGKYMERTTIRTVEITEIGDAPERDIQKLIKDYLGVDDVKIIKEQTFDFPRIPWTTDQYLIRLALQYKAGKVSADEFADTVIDELSKMMLPSEALRCLGSL